MKHLDYLQAVITRMADRSADLKNYCLTLSAAVIGFSAIAKDGGALIGLAALIAVFAFLDASYLRNERAFRTQYDMVRNSPLESQPDFEIRPDLDSHDLLTSAMSWSVVGFYFPIVIIVLFASSRV